MNAPAAIVPSRFNVAVAPPGGDLRALYNTATGNYLVLDDDSFALLQKLSAGVAVIDEANWLLDWGFAVPGNVDEVGAVGEAFSIARAARYAPQLTITPTMDCNFGCRYCFETHIKGTMPLTVQDRLLQFSDYLLERTSGQRNLSVTWFGGEPIMGLKAIERLSRQFLERRRRGVIENYKASIITNGFGLTPGVCDALERAEISHAQITLDGPARIHDQRRFLKRTGAPTFDTIVANIRNLPTSISVLIRMNVDRDNQDSYPELFEALDGAGLLSRVLVDLGQVENFSRQPTAPNVLSSREFARFKAGAIEYCAARGWPLATQAPTPSITGVCQVDSANSFVVSAKGQLYKCWAELENEGRAVGDLADPSRWSNFVLTDLTGRDPLDDEECRACALLPTCMGSCPKTRSLNRSFHGKQCPPFKYYFADLIYKQFGHKSSLTRKIRPSAPQPATAEAIALPVATSA